MKQRKIWSICLIIALIFSSVFGWNETTLTIYAKSSEKAEQVVVYVAAQGKSSDGTKKVSIGKTPMQVKKGTMASTVVEEVLKSSEYKEDYEILDTGYGPYLESIHGMGTEVVDAANYLYNYWSFYVNGQYSNVGMGQYEVQDGDQISLIYSYEDSSMQAAVFADNTSLNPETAAIETAETAMTKAQEIVGKDIYEAYFADGHIPGMANPDELYVVFSLARAGYVAPKFYGRVKQKLQRQLWELANKGKTYDFAIDGYVTEDTFAEKKAPEQYLAKIVLAMTALGMDAGNTCGYDLIEKMASKKYYKDSSPYSREQMMLLAFDSGKYSLPEGDDYCTREELVAKITENIDNDIETSIQWGIDTAVMAIQPLLPYIDSASVENACEKVIRFAGKMQDTNGYIGDSYNANNVWTLSQTLIMLGEFGIHPLVEKNGVDFVKNGHTLIDAALEFVDLDQKKTAESVFAFQPEQLLRGITAFAYTCANAKESLYRVVTIPHIIDSTEPFEPEKPTESATPTPSVAPSATPSATPSAAPSATPCVSPSATPCSTPGVTPSATPSVTPCNGVKKPLVTKNPVKKVVATKKTIKVKKGKMATIVLKVTAKNAKKVTTDSVKVSAKKIKVKKIVKEAGKITIKVKTMKKGKQVVKIKVGKVSTKVTMRIQ
ncbi:MAG: DUF4430 domain-containing protein [Eubacterium sp.]